jgi:L-cysteine desulfidase
MLKYVVTRNLLSMLKNEVKPALGCTAPIAVALAAARAREELPETPAKIEVLLSPGIYKNGWGVMFPGGRGNALGAALGALGGNSGLGMEVLRNVTAADVDLAKKMVGGGKVCVKCEPQYERLYIKVSVWDSCNVASAIIKDTHDNLVSVELNDKALFDKKTCEVQTDAFGLDELTLKELVKHVELLPLADIEFLLDSSSMNLELAEAGLSDRWGHSIGRGIEDLVKKGSLSTDVSMQARIMCAAACDARMGGINLPAMSSAGSGNQGIVATLPVAIVAKKHQCPKERLIRALAISHLINVFIKGYTGRIATICSCAIAAGVGASVAITWMLRGDFKAINSAINNVLASLAGMVCDGAKNGCAFKLATSAQEAVIAAYLALNRVTANSYDGIIEDNAELTIKNLGEFSQTVNLQLDGFIVDLIKNKPVNTP